MKGQIFWSCHLRLKEVSDPYYPLLRCSFETARLVSKLEPTSPPEYFCAPLNLQNTFIILIAHLLLLFLANHGRKACTFLHAVVKGAHLSLKEVSQAFLHPNLSLVASGLQEDSTSWIRSIV